MMEPSNTEHTKQWKPSKIQLPTTYPSIVSIQVYLLRSFSTSAAFIIDGKRLVSPSIVEFCFFGRAISFRVSGGTGTRKPDFGYPPQWNGLKASWTRIFFIFLPKFLAHFDDFSKLSVVHSVYWRCCETLKNHQIWKKIGKKEKSHFSADSRYPKIGFRVYPFHHYSLGPAIPTFLTSERALIVAANSRQNHSWTVFSGGNCGLFI